jgi:hypothetical protein
LTTQFDAIAAEHGQPPAVAGVSAHFIRLAMDEGATRFMAEVQDPPDATLSARLGDRGLDTIARESPGLLRGSGREEE